MRMKIFRGYIKGINLGGWLSQCRHEKEHYDAFITEEDICRISSIGADHIRLPIDYETVETEDGEILESGFGYIDRCVEWCGKYRLNVVLDVHKTAGFSFDDTDNTLFASPELQQRFLRLWDRISGRYGGYENVAFELLNEIVEQTAQRWNTLAQRAVDVIRSNAPDTPIIIGGVQWNSVHTLKLLDKPQDKNVVFNFHFYEPFLFTHQSAPWQPIIPKREMNYPGDIDEYRRRSKEINCFGSGLYNVDGMGAGFMVALIKEAVEAAENADVPLYCGEYGVDDFAPVQDTLRWFEDIHSVFEKYGIGRAAWSYKGMNFGLTDEHYGEIFQKIAKLL